MKATVYHWYGDNRKLKLNGQVIEMLPNPPYIPSADVEIDNLEQFIRDNGNCIVWVMDDGFSIAFSDKYHGAFRQK